MHYRIDDLQYNGLKLKQEVNGYCFTSDAVLLSSFVRAKAQDTIVDFGCGNGVISILVASKTNCKTVVGIEIQSHVSELAKENVQLNNMLNQVQIVCDDIKNAAQILGKESVEVVVCNPPYFAQSSGIKKQTDTIALSRHESNCTIEDIAKSASNILKYGGRLFMIHKCERMAQVLTCLTNNSLIPKSLTLICPKQNKTPDTFIVEAKKHAHTGMKIQNLIVYNDDGSYTTAAKKLYNIVE